MDEFLAGLHLAPTHFLMLYPEYLTLSTHRSFTHYMAIYPHLWSHIPMLVHSLDEGRGFDSWRASGHVKLCKTLVTRLRSTGDPMHREEANKTSIMPSVWSYRSEMIKENLKWRVNCHSVIPATQLLVTDYRCWSRFYFSTIISNRIESFHIIVYRIILYHIVSYCIVSYRIILYRIISTGQWLLFWLMADGSHGSAGEPIGLVILSHD